MSDKIENLILLKKERQELLNIIKDISSIYNIDPKLFSAEIWFNLINSNQDANNNDVHLGILALREKFRAEHALRLEKLQKLNKEIFESNIDILLDKIRIINVNDR